MQKIGFIGLGTMGLPMARNLLRAGFKVYVFNRTAEKACEFAKEGALQMSSPADVAREAQIVFTMLTADQAVEDVVLGVNGIREGISAGKIYVDSSTIAPATSKRLGQVLAEIGVEMLDAPVTGSEPQAIEGMLTFMAGGKKEIFEQCQPVFRAMSKASYYMGASGSGSYTKLANNSISAMNLLSVAEGMILAAKSGVDPEVFVQVVSGGGAASAMMDYKAGKIINRDFHANFATALMCKDLRLAAELAAELKIPVPVLSAVRQMLLLADVKGYSQEDMSAVIKCYEEWAGIQVKKQG